MRDLLGQIRRASGAGLYYAALFPALALPDICAALESDDGIATAPRYIAWFDKWVAPRYQGWFSGEDCYAFRCSLLHQGSTQHPRSRYARILFLEPGSGMVLHNNILNDALNIDVRIFCEDVAAGVEAWLPEAEELPHYRKNRDRFISRYERGLPPYIVGVPVIA